MIGESRATSSLYGSNRANSVQNLNIKKIMLQGCIGCCVIPIACALFIIGCCAAAGALSGVVAGGWTIGLSVPMLLATILMGRKDALGNDTTVHLISGIITYIGLIIIGSLAAAHVISAISVGYTILGIAALGLALSCIKFYCLGGYRQVMSLIGTQNAW